MNSIVNTNNPYFHKLQYRDQIRCPQSNVKTSYEIAPTKKKETFRTKEYELTQNIFDPSKQSPPNNFMQKLQKRVGIYN
jgi:hypothetical protein